MKKVAAATTLAVTLLSVEACNPKEAFKDDGRVVALSETQAKKLHEAVREEGSYYYDTVLHPNRWGFGDGHSEGPQGQSARQPFKLGESVRFRDLLEQTEITPKIEDGIAYVHTVSSFENLAYSSEEERVLANPDQSIFGTDGIVTKEEMLTFYADEGTVLIRSSRGIKSDIDPTCTYTIELSGSDLTYQDNSAEGCISGDVSDATFVRKLTDKF